MMTYEKLIFDLVHACAEAGKRVSQQLTMCGDFKGMRLYYRPATVGSCGALELLHQEETPQDDFVLASPDVLHGGVPYNNYFHWVKQRVTRLPILSPCMV